MQELERGDSGLRSFASVQGSLVMYPIHAYGTEAQKRRWLPELAAGRAIGCFGLTEPDFGSFASGMLTKAVRHGGEWVLNGTKQFITHGASADVLVAMAVTAKGKGSRGISAFVIERGTPGCRPGRKEDKLGMRASETSEVVFEGCRIPASHLIGQEGQGFVNALQVLDAGRIGIAALAVGLAQGAYDAARGYAFQRHQFGQPIGTFQSVRAKLVDAAMRIRAARLLTYRAASLKDAGARFTLESAMAKLYSSEIAVRVSEDGVQVHGGYGFVKDYPAEKFFRDVKLTTIGEGTNEVQRLVIARQLLALDKSSEAPSPTGDHLGPASPR